MSLPNITFVKGQGGLGRPLPGQDFISGMIFYTATLPGGFTSSARIKALFSPQDAINAGILNDYSDGTGATGTYLITVAGATNDVITISVKEMSPTGQLQTTILCKYTKVSTDTTIAILGASITAAINVGTQTHGYTASFLTATITIVAPKKLGIFLNTGTPLVVAVVGTIAGTITQFTGGLASAFAFYYYHISEFFRLQPQGVLYVGFFAVPGSYTFTAEVTSLVNFSIGTIRQLGVAKDFASAWASADVTALEAALETLDPVHKPASTGVYTADLSGTADITTLFDFSTSTSYKIAVPIGQDAGGTGYFNFLASGKSVGQLGALLGTVALAKVSESIGWIAKFNISDGAEDEVLGFANGQLYNNSTISASLENILNVLNARRYTFLRKFVGISGSYWNDSNTAVTPSSDYSQIENNRTIDKAIRGIYAALLPSLNGPLQLNADGSLSETTTAWLESQADVALDQMVRDAELSAKDVSINPNQDVLATSTIIINVELVINGVARQIQVNIGFTPKIA